jgi:hypothetical protein
MTIARICIRVLDPCPAQLTPEFTVYVNEHPEEPEPYLVSAQYPTDNNVRDPSR